MKLPESIREQFRAYGRAGGRTRAEQMSPEARARVARKAAIGRWIRARFGAGNFTELGLPGADLIDTGLTDLAAGRESMESLLVSLAAPRLRREGVPLPGEPLPDADVRLYRLLEQKDAGMAHSRYLACLRQAASFADACAEARVT